MNTIRRSTSRPRVKSCNFRSLWWVVVREPYLNIRRSGHPAHAHTLSREALCQVPTWRIIQKGERAIQFNVNRRYYP